TPSSVGSLTTGSDSCCHWCADTGDDSVARCLGSATAVEPAEPRRSLLLTTEVVVLQVLRDRFSQRLLVLFSASLVHGVRPRDYPVLDQLCGRTSFVCVATTIGK